MHASAREGIRLSRAGRRVMFSHNSPQALEEVVSKEMSADNGSIHAGHKNVFVVVESLYSMDGDICPLREIVSVMKRLLPQGNGYLIVDEAHATGVYGHHGAGIVQDLGLEKDVFIRVHTFGKALASHGDTREYLVNYARTLIYTTAMGFPSLASIRTAYEFLSEGLTETYPRELAAVCQAEGFVVRAIMAPTVPEGKERVRICLHAENTTEEIEALVEVLARGLREQKLNRSKL
ncbi:hypothetical protein KEM55_006567 [Ascosphaera atra]|nr:hypothetical protein KEM55_006567 [Ascosphaera atra]